MINELLPIELHAADFLAFVRQHDVAVVKLRTLLDPTFSKALIRKFAARFPRIFGAGMIDATEVNLSTEIRRLIQPIAPYLPSGYYLFYKGQFIGYSAGAVDPDIVARYLLVIGAITLGSGKNARDYSKGAKAFNDLVEDEKASQVFQYFIGLIDGINSTATGGARQDFVDSEVENAYKFFGLSVGADASEVERVWKKKLKQCHPDTKGGDSEVLSKIAAEVNRQHDIITNARKRK